MKKNIAIMLAVVLMLSLAPMASFAAGDVKVQIEGTAVTFPDAKPFVDQNYRTLVPLSPVASAMGIDVKWDQTAQTATFTQEYTVDKSPLIDKADATHKTEYFVGKETLVFTAGKTDAVYTAYFYDSADTEKKTPIEAKTFKKTITMDTAAVNQDARVYAPIKYLAETFGCAVNWDEATSTVAIIKNSDYPVKFLGNTEKHVAVGYFQTRWYEVMGSPEVKIQSVTVDGKTATCEAFSEKDLTVLKNEGGTLPLAGGRIMGDFTLDKSHKVIITFELKQKDGTAYTAPYAFDYAPEGYGGIL